MTIRRAALLAFTLLAEAAGMAAPLTWGDLTSRPQPKASATIGYGADPLQHVDLWLPAGKGPFPVVLMVHGGCWQTDVAKADLMNWIADDLRKRGIAVWNIEYRGIDRPGGGYPGTFLDAAAASDLLRTAAAKYKLDLKRVVAVGHSAGGHLALWLAARRGIAPNSPLYAEAPLKLTQAISLGGLPDLEAASVPPGNTCGSDAVTGLVGQARAERTDVYIDTSPARMGSPGIPVTLVNATRDRIAPPAFAEAYAVRMKGEPRRVVIPEEGHVELIAPETKSWAATVKAIEAAVRP
jgi:acetyl esterase/lipase